MKKQMHRLLSLMLSLILVVGLIPGTAFAAEPAKITSVALTNAPESYTVGEELGTLTSPGGVGAGIDIEGYMMVESDMSSFHYYAVTPMSPTSTFKADKYYYYVVMIDHIDGYASTDSTIYTINGKTAKAEWFAADENNCLLCVVPYDKTTGQMKNYDCPIAVPGGFTAIDSVDISGVPESFTPGNVIDVDLKGDSFTVSNPHAILGTDRDWYVDWYKFDSDTFGFYEFLDSTSHAVVSNQTFSGDKYYYIRIILTADVENGYMFTENTTFTINGKTAAWSMYATAGLFAYVYAAVWEDAPAVQPTTKPTTVPTTKLTTKPTTQLTTKSTTVATTQPTNQLTTKSTTVATTQPTPQLTTKPTTVATTQPTTQLTAKPTTVATTQPIIQPTTEPTIATKPAETTEPTTTPTSAPSVTPSTAPGGVADGGEEAPNLLWLWVLIAAVAVGGIVLFIILGKKKNQ